MLTKEIRIKGGIAAAKIKKEKNLKNYLDNPNICLNCNSKIFPKENQLLSEVKCKKFCSSSCFASFNNIRRIKKSKEIIHKKSKLEKRMDNLKLKTKKELFNECKNYFSARCSITKLAKNTIKHSNKEKVCENCGYKNHVEICHIKAVSDFKDNDTLYEMNCLENLMYLCPNCHWEFDHSLLKIEDIKQKSRFV